MPFETPGPHPASYVEQTQSETGADVQIFFELTKRAKRFLVLLPSNPYILRVRSYIRFCLVSLDQGGSGAPPVRPAIPELSEGTPSSPSLTGDP